MLLLLHGGLLAQDFFLEFEGPAEDLQKIDVYHIRKQTGDSLSLISQLHQLQRSLEQDGYLRSELNPRWQDGNHLVVRVDLKERYQWLHLDAGNVDRGLLQKSTYKEKLYSNQPFRYPEVQHLMEQLVDFSVNAGYPFASIKLDCVQVRQQTVKAKLNHTPGPFITFDSLIISKPVKINRRFLQAYLRIPVGSTFSEEMIGQIPARIDKLPYLRLSEAPHLTFQNDQASAHLSLEPVRSNQIDGIIGFLPNSKGDGQLLLTGQLNLLLQNIFGSGRRLNFYWESFKPESQQLNIGFFQPMLLRSPIDLDIQFNLFKEDSTFINRLFTLRMEYAYGKHHFFGLNSNIKSSRLPSSDLFQDLTNFPDLADFNLNQFGANYRFDNLDNYLNPKSGVKLQMMASAGTKKIRRNSSISDSLYTELDLESNQYSWEVVLDGYLPVSKYWVLATGWSGGGVYNDRLFFNDLYRLGGLRSIRGFSENTLFAENYAYSTLEPRFYFETNSYLFAFYDQAWWLRYSLENNQFKDTPWGVGAGISLTTKAGIFSFVWALGSSKSQEIGLNQSKIHFGYISRF